MKIKYLLSLTALTLAITACQQASTPASETTDTASVQPATSVTTDSKTTDTSAAHPAVSTAQPNLTTIDQKKSYISGYYFFTKDPNFNMAILQEHCTQQPQACVGLDMKLFQQGYNDAKQKLNVGFAEKLTQELVETLAQTNKAAGAAFLEKNKTEPGVVTLPDGLQYKVLTEGKGAIPTAADEVTVNYEGTLLDGKVFDSSYARHEPATFPVTGVIPGWVEILQKMPVGSIWMVYIPAGLAYGSQGSGAIAPESTLIFKIELLGIKDQKADAGK